MGDRRHLTMFKRNRRGNYANRCTNADTFWKSVLKTVPLQERLVLAYPPDKYYALPSLQPSDRDATPRCSRKANAALTAIHGSLDKVSSASLSIAVVGSYKQFKTVPDHACR